jgi:hypothetical protein
MPNTLAVVTHQSDTGLAKDNVVNTFALDQFSSSNAPADRTTITDALIAFYNTAPAPEPSPICNFLSPVLDITANRSSVKLYDIPAPGVPMGSPYFTRAFTLGAPAGAATALPSEVAVAITLEADGRADAAVELGNGTRPKSRHTGRLFIGPLNNQSITVVAGVARPNTNMLTTFRQAVANLQAAIQAVPAADLAVWSRADNLVRALEAVSTDNAFDTQRRRGEAPTSRVRLVLP